MKSFCVIVLFLFSISLQAQHLSATNLLLCSTTKAADSVLTANKFSVNDVSTLTSSGVSFTNTEYMRKGYFPHITVTSANNTLSYITIELYKDSKQFTQLQQQFLNQGYTATSTDDDEKRNTKTMYSSAKHPHTKFETIVYNGAKTTHYTITLYWDTEVTPVKY